MANVKDDYTYQVGKPVTKGDESYRLYRGIQQDTKRQCLIQIALTKQADAELKLAAGILDDLAFRAEEIEKEYARVKADPKVMLNYQLAFPEVLDSFDCSVAGKWEGRRTNIYVFRNIEDISLVVPLAKIIGVNRRRIDLKSSVWIIGKILKLLNFAHSEGVYVHRLNTKNILIEPDRHYVVIFDWSGVQLFERNKIPADLRRRDISQAAKAVIAVLGGDADTGVFPDDGDKAFDEYLARLMWLAKGKEDDARKAHAEFYELKDGLWDAEFHPFTTLPL